MKTINEIKIQSVSGLFYVGYFFTNGYFQIVGGSYETERSAKNAAKKTAIKLGIEFNG